METELIATIGTTSASLDLKDDVPVSLNYAIANVKDPSKRDGAFSKTIKLPGTSKNNEFFEYLFDVNIATRTFNPMLKTNCYVLQESVEVFKGYLRLLEIEVELVNDIQLITYSIAIFGDNKELFGAIGDKKLEDLDLSIYNHVYNRVNQFASWSASLGTGYLYPLIDYGYNNFLTNSFRVEHLRPAFYAKTLLDKIFSDAGKTYTSSFLNSTFFKRLFVPHNGDKFTMSASNLALYECYVGNSGAISSNTLNLTFTGSLYNEWNSNAAYTSTSNSFAMKYNDDTTLPFIDTGNTYNTTTGILTIAQSGTYNINFNIDFEIKLSAVPAGTVTIANGLSGAWDRRYSVLHSIDGGVTWNIIYNNPNNQSTTPLSTSYQSFNFVLALPTTSFNSGDLIKLLIHPLWISNGRGVRFLDGGGNPISAGTATIDWRFRSVATMKTSLSIGDYVSGQTLDINDAIPKNYKQKDFLLSIFKLGNLYIDIDPGNPNNYLIEQRDDFYSAGGTKDWSLKLALDKPFVVKLMTEIDIKNFIYRYKSDTDYYNKKYEDMYQEPYGTHTEIVVNDFSNKDDVNEVMFSPTPVVDNPNNSMILPKIFNYDGTVVKPQKHNIRILMYNGTSGNSPTWDYVAPTSDALGAATLPMSQYPLSAMVDDPLNPTVSIEFGVPNTVFYSLGTNYTTNNIYNRCYSKFITEISDRDSRMVTAYFYLTPLDIATFDFRDKVFVKDALYFVNKISDYNKLKPGLAKVELLKIKNASAYTPTQVSVSTIATNIGGGGGITARMWGNDPNETNIGNANNVLIGENNSSRSVGSFMSGSRNTVSENSMRVSLINCTGNNVGNNCDSITMQGCSGNNIGSYCSGIVLMNCNGLNIDEYTYNYTAAGVNNKDITTADSNTANIGDITDVPVKVRTITSDVNISTSILYDEYLISAASGNITVTLIDTGIEYTIKKTDSSANKVILTSADPVSIFIDGVGTKDILVQYNSITVYNYNGQWYIK